MPPTCSGTRRPWPRGAERVVVVGSGYIGLEMAEAFVERGCSAVVVEQAAQPMGTLDPDMGALVAEAMVGPRHRPALWGGGDGLRAGDGADRRRADRRRPGGARARRRPERDAGRRAGLELGAQGAIHVDERQATSAPGVWAAGDCAESRHLVTGQSVHIALGTVRQQARPGGRDQHRRRPRDVPRRARHRHHEAVRHRDRPHRARRGRGRARRVRSVSRPDRDHDHRPATSRRPPR